MTDVEKQAMRGSRMIEDYPDDCHAAVPRRLLAAALLCLGAAAGLGLALLLNWL
jgi:hypothetical protein